MNRQKRYLHLPIFLIGILFLAACSSSNTAQSTEEDEREVIDVTESSVPDTEIPVIEGTPTSGESMDEDPEYRIITLLPKDAIRSIDDPEFYSVAEADEEYSPGEFVIGVEFDGQARAYSIPLLSSREIVNDTINGRPISVTW